MDIIFKNLLIISLLLSPGIINTQDLDAFCGQSTNTGPPLPPLSQHSFRAEIAGKIIERNRSVHAIQTVSLEANKSSLFWTAANTSQFFIYNRATDQTIAGDAISCSELAHDDPLRMLVSSTMHALEGDVEYVNSVQIKGIPSNHWRKCSSWNMGINFTMDIYITENHILWNMPSQLPNVPVRIELTGQMWENGKITQIHHIYDYIQFEQFEGDKYNSAFQPPAGVLCPGLHMEIPMPDMPTSLSYSCETKVSGQKSVETLTIFYDFDDKISRTDYFDSNHAMRLVKDFNEGVIYKIDMEVDSCEILPMTLLEIQDNGTLAELNWQYTFDANGYVQMKTVNEYFLRNGNFTYEGEQQVRGIPCELYSQKVQNYKGYHGWTLIGLYFSKSHIKVYNTQGSVDFMENQLMRVTVENEKVTTSTDIYNMDPQPLPIKNPFDVSMCFNASSQIPFVIDFSPETPVPESQDLYRFRKIAVQHIALAANVSFFRVHWDEVSTENNIVYLYGKILDVPPALARYMKIFGMKQDSSVLTSSLQATVHTQVGLTASACAVYCSKELSLGPLPETIGLMPICDSFDFCEGSSSCYFYQPFSNNKFEYLVDDAECDHFQKTTSSPRPTQLVEAWSRLRESVYKEQLDIEVTQPNGSFPGVMFSGEGISNLNPTSEDLEMADSPLFDYTEIPDVQLYDPLLHNDTIAIDDCARLCSNTQSFQCLTFVYCKDNLTCALHDVSFSERMPHSMTSSCSAYSRSYVKDFEQILDTSISAVSDTLIKNIYDKEQCAYLCLTNATFACESFEICNNFGESVCYLGHIHIFDLPRDDIVEDPNCVHYSRNYATDFNEIPNKKTSYTIDRTITGVSVTQCAWICSTQTSYSCSVFQFCDNLGLCQLINTKAQNKTASFLDKDSCSIYTRKRNSASQAPTIEPSKSSMTPVNKSPKPDNVTKELVMSSRTGYSGGAMAGMAVGMAALGVILCLLGIFIYARVRHNKDNTDVIELTTDEHSEHD